MCNGINELGAGKGEGSKKNVATKGGMNEVKREPQQKRGNRQRPKLAEMERNSTALSGCTHK